MKEEVRTHFLKACIVCIGITLSLPCAAQEVGNKLPSIFTAKEARPAKMANKFLKYISDGKYVKAVEYKLDIFDKAKEFRKENPKVVNTIMDAMYPAWEIGNAILFYRQATDDEKGIMIYDPAKAYELFSGVVRKGELMSEMKAYIADKHNGVKGIDLEAVQNDIEEILVKEAKETNTEKAYDSLYYALLDNSKYKAEIYELFEKTAYATIEKTPTLAGYNRFLEVFPKSEHVASVTVLRDSLHIQEMNKTVKACDAFLTAYPQSKFTDKVKRMRETYASADIEATGTLDDCKAFFDMYPNSQYSQRVQDRVLSLMVRPEVTYKDFLDYEEKFGTMKDSRVVKAFNMLNNLETHWRYLGFKQPVKSMVERAISKTEEQETTYKFNSNGLVTSTENTKYMTNESYEYEFVPKQGWHIKAYYHHTPRSEVTMTYVYDNNNYLQAKKSSNGATIEYESGLSEFTEKEYTSRRRLLVTRTYDFLGKLQRTENTDGSTTTYEYDIDGLLVKETKSQGGASTVYTYVYETNDKGDWTRQDKMKNGDVVQTKLREITYDVID